MNSSREQAFFEAALEKPPEKRTVFLEAVCNGDSALRARLEALLAAHEQPATLLVTQAEAAHQAAEWKQKRSAFAQAASSRNCGAFLSRIHAEENHAKARSREEEGRQMGRRWTFFRLTKW